MGKGKTPTFEQVVKRWYEEMKRKRNEQSRNKSVEFFPNSLDRHWSPQIEHCALSLGYLSTFDYVFRYSDPANLAHGALP